MSPVIAILPVVAVAAVVVAVIALAWTLFGGTLFGGNAANTRAASVIPPLSASGAPSGAASGAASGTATEGAKSAATTPPPASAKTQAPVDKTIAVVVLNSTNRTGLARRASEKLNNDGWTKATFSHKTATGQTVVYYATADQKASAEEIVQVLEVGTVKKSARMAGDGITVVVGSDYP